MADDSRPGELVSRLAYPWLYYPIGPPVLRVQLERPGEKPDALQPLIGPDVKKQLQDRGYLLSECDLQRPI